VPTHAFPHAQNYTTNQLRTHAQRRHACMHACMGHACHAHTHASATEDDLVDNTRLVRDMRHSIVARRALRSPRGTPCLPLLLPPPWRPHIHSNPGIVGVKIPVMLRAESDPHTRTRSIPTPHAQLSFRLQLLLAVFLMLVRPALTSCCKHLSGADCRRGYKSERARIGGDRFRRLLMECMRT
jgi:hypothetical protein